MLDEKLLQVLKVFFTINKHLLIVILIACFLLYIFLKKLTPNINNEFSITKKLINNDCKEKKGKIPNEYDSLLTQA